MADMLDFDRMLQEARGETITVIVGGRRYDAPKAVPAVLMLEMLRAGDETDPALRGVMVWRAACKAARVFFGDAALDEILSVPGMTMPQLIALVDRVTRLALGLPDDAAEGTEFDETAGKIAPDAGKA